MKNIESDDMDRPFFTGLNNSLHKCLVIVSKCLVVISRCLVVVSKYIVVVSKCLVVVCKCLVINLFLIF